MEQTDVAKGMEKKREWSPSTVFLSRSEEAVIQRPDGTRFTGSVESLPSGVRYARLEDGSLRRVGKKGGHQ